MIETLVLSILSILLGAIELCTIKKILHYTEEPKSKKKKVKDDDSSDADDLDKKFHKDKMKDRNDVKTNKQLFLNKKLDELLT